MSNEKATCFGCRKHPEQISEYVNMAVMIGHTAEEAVRQEEVTYDYETGYFTCTECYVLMGMPSEHELLNAFRGRGATA